MQPGTNPFNQETMSRVNYKNSSKTVRKANPNESVTFAVFPMRQGCYLFKYGKRLSIMPLTCSQKPVIIYMM